MTTIHLGFDAATLASLGRIAEFDSWLAATFVADAMPKSLDELQQASQAVMLSSFINPTGKAETWFRKYVSSPWRGILGNYAPYGQRLEYGFSGMTDALGRYYIYWPDYHWAEQAVELATPYVEEHFRDAVNEAINEVR